MSEVAIQGSIGRAARRPALAGAIGAGLWLLAEGGAKSAVVLAALSASGTPASSPLPPWVMALALPFMVLAAGALGVLLFLFLARRDRLTATDLGYRWSRRVLVAGGLAGVLLYAALTAAIQVDDWVFGSQDEFAAIRAGLRAVGWWPAAAFVVGNGVALPVAEELAWRGYIQPFWTQAWGLRTGIVATALAFAGKHMLLDWYVGRTTTLVLGALILGVTGWRWGTVASTLAHIVTNLVLTLFLVVDAFFGH